LHFLHFKLLTSTADKNGTAPVRRRFLFRAGFFGKLFLNDIVKHLRDKWIFAGTNRKTLNYADIFDKRL